MNAVPFRMVADLGNSHLKWGRLSSDPDMSLRIAMPIDDLSSWGDTFDAWGLSADDAWAISSVNPPATEAFRGFLADRGVREIRWYRSAADVEVAHRLAHPEKTGADRALAVKAAMGLGENSKAAGLVISCGTAVTVERIAGSGIWQGGAIAPGLGLASLALKRGTAQLPLVEIGQEPVAWGNATSPAIAAGVFWGTVGSIRELIARQADLSPKWVVWTGGYASLMAPLIDGPSPWIVPDLVLIGLARSAFGIALEEERR